MQVARRRPKGHGSHLTDEVRRIRRRTPWQRRDDLARSHAYQRTLVELRDLHRDTFARLYWRQLQRARAELEPPPE